MERIRPEELPDILTDDVIDILAAMADEIPQSKEWHEIFELLSPNDYRRVMDRKYEIQQKEEKERLNGMSKEETALEQAKWDRIRQNGDLHKFYGNMGEPATIEEYRNKYGVYPPGYDENGNKT